MSGKLCYLAIIAFVLFEKRQIIKREIIRITLLFSYSIID